MSDRCRIIRDADLRARNTFGVAARAPLLVEVDALEALPEALERHLPAGTPPLLLGGGSNLLFAADPDMPLLALRAAGRAILDDRADTAVVRAEAGAHWHEFVGWTLDQGLGGLENLALIPGTVGAAPIQNIGAYGVEVCERVLWVEAFHPATGTAHRIAREDCGFAYRDSRFKREAGEWIVTAVAFSLSRGAAPRIAYAGLGEELAAAGVDTPGAREVYDAVCAIRRRKLPDPALVGNAGSFFKNPIIPESQAQALALAHPALPRFAAGDGLCKLSAAWLIDACGWKGHRDGDAGVSDRHALVLVNHGDASGAQLLALARRIAGSVQARFGVALEPEPRIVGATW